MHQQAMHITQTKVNRLIADSRPAVIAGSVLGLALFLSVVPAFSWDLRLQLAFAVTLFLAVLINGFEAMVYVQALHRLRTGAIMRARQLTERPLKDRLSEGQK